MEQKIVAHGYDNVDLEISDLQDKVNILTVTNVSWVSDLSHNLLSTIPLAKKSIEMFLKKTRQPTEIVIDEEIFGIANIIKNQYVIRLDKILKSATINQITAPTIETWYT